MAGVPARATSVDVYRPSNACGAPVVGWVHGGGWRTGDKVFGIADKIRLAREQGWVLVSVNYRLTDPSGHLYQVKFDPPNNPEMASGAEVIGAAIYHAIGYNIVFISSHTFNFAQAQLMMVGTFVAYTGLVTLKLPILVVAVTATVAVMILAGLEEIVAVRPVHDHQNQLVTTLGAATLINGATQLIWGSEPLTVPFFGSNDPITVLGGRTYPVEIVLLERERQAGLMKVLLGLLDFQLRAVGHELLERPADGPLAVEHPSGSLAVDVALTDDRPPRVARSTVVRTARPPFDGVAFPRP